MPTDAIEQGQRSMRSRRYLDAASKFSAARASGDPRASRMLALAHGAWAEYRLGLADALSVRPNVEEIESMLERGLEADDTLMDLHWDLAVVHGRFTGDLERARRHLADARARADGPVHSLEALLELNLARGKPPEPVDQSPHGQLRALLFALFSDLADGSLPEQPLVAEDAGMTPWSFAGYRRRASELGRELPLPDVIELRARLNMLVARRIISEDAFDYGLDLLVDVAVAKGNPVVIRELVHDRLRHSIQFCHAVARKNPRLARRIVEHAEEVLARTKVELDAKLRGELEVARAQGFVQPEHAELPRALDHYANALDAFREAGELGSATRVEQLLQQMIGYAIQQGMGVTAIGIGELGATLELLERGWERAQGRVPPELELELGRVLSEVYAATAQPRRGAEILATLLEQCGDGSEISPAKLDELRFTLASRLSEDKRPGEAAAIQSELLERTDGEPRAVLLMNYANSLRELGRYDASEQALREALAIHEPPADEHTIDHFGAQLHANLGQLALAQGELERARIELERAADLSEDMGDAPVRISSLLARVHLQAGRYDAAVEQCARASSALQRRLSDGRPSLAIWTAMLAEWSRLDEMGLWARAKRGDPARELLISAEATKGRILRLLTDAQARREPAQVFSTEHVTAHLERVLAQRWVLISMFASDHGLLLFRIAPDSDVALEIIEGPLYHHVRTRIVEAWEMLAPVATDRGSASLLAAVGLDSDMLLRSMAALDESLLIWLGTLLEGRGSLAGGGSQLILIPHRMFRILPLSHARLRGGQVLSEVWREIVVAPSLQDLGELLERPAPLPGPLEAFVDPETNLPFARVEALAGFFSAYEVGESATEATLRRRLGQPGQLHISCHGCFETAHPWHSWLATCDGRLHLHELLVERVVTRSLVVLGACELGAGQRSNADEPIGFPVLLLRGGALQVIAPSWPVDDFAAFLLLTRLHQLLGQGAPPAAALAQASSWLRGLDAPTVLARLDWLVERMNAGEAGESLAAVAKQLAANRRWLCTLSPDARPFIAPRDWAAFQIYGIPSVCSADAEPPIQTHETSHE